MSTTIFWYLHLLTIIAIVSTAIYDLKGIKNDAEEYKRMGNDPVILWCALAFATLCPIINMLYLSYILSEYITIKFIDEEEENDSI